MKVFGSWVALAATLATLVAGQSSTSSTATPTSSSPPTRTDGEITIHTVTVGDVENQFSPDNITATPGDIITFVFYPSNHSVIESVYGFPCIPSEDTTGQQGFYSGFEPIDNTTGPFPMWNLTVNTTDPVWFYCGAPGSCIGYSMLGVINVNTSESLDVQKKLAAEANYMLEPGEAVDNAALSSMAALAASATAISTASSASSASPTSITSTAPAATTSAAAASHHSGLSTGAIAGIVIGAVAVLVLGAALFFLLGRTKTLKEMLHHHSSGGAPPQMQDAGAAAGYGYGQNRHLSNQLPPYQPAYNVMENKPPHLAQTNVRSMSQVASPDTQHGFHYAGFAPQSQSDFRFSGTAASEQGSEIVPPLRSMQSSPVAHELSTGTNPSNQGVQDRNERYA